jgi:UDP-N-acetyl-D-galactosamine dehydrogenase
MPAFIVDQLVKKMVKTVGLSRDTVVTVLGATFKENVPDVRNSKVADICEELGKYGVKVQVVDPLADQTEVEHELGLTMVSLEDAQANPADAVILAVPHQDFIADGGWSLMESLAKPELALVMDFKAKLNADNAPAHLHVCR